MAKKPKKSAASARVASGGRIANVPYPGTLDKKEKWTKRISRILMWAVLVAVVGALVAWLSIITGGAALPAGMTLFNFLMIEAGVGFLEGILYGTVSEFISEKAAQDVMRQVQGEVSPTHRVRPVPIEDVETQTRPLINPNIKSET